MKRYILLPLLSLSTLAWGNIPQNIEEFPFPRNVLDEINDISGEPPAAIPAPPAPGSQQQQLTQKDLMQMDRDHLDALYKTLPSGPIPDGDSRGRATLSAGSGFGAGSEKVLHVFWQGKIFHRTDALHGELVNKILGQPAIKAEVYYAKSLLDGKESIILDYSKIPDLVIHNIRDEIRMAAPGLYYGYAYVKGPFGWSKKPLIFALDFNK